MVKALTIIRCSLKKTSIVQFEVYNLLGIKLAIIVKEQLTAGYHLQILLMEIEGKHERMSDFSLVILTKYSIDIIIKSR